MSDKDDKKKDKAQRTGSVNPEDAELTTWLHRLWARNEPPERLEVWQMFGRNKSIRGEMIHHEDFKANDKLDVERANKLANEVIAAAQHDCDSTPGGRPANYQIAVVDKNRKAAPLTRRLGPIFPQRQYRNPKALELVDGDEEGEEGSEDTPVTAKSLLFAMIKEGMEQSRWDKTRLDRGTGEILLLQRSIIIDQQNWIDKLFNRSMDHFRLMQDAEDRRLDRDQAREWNSLKVLLAKDGLRTVRNLLPGLFAPGGSTVTDGGGGGPDGGGGGPGGQNGAANGNGAPKSYGPSPERTLVENFLKDAEDDGLSVALFGDFEKEEDGKLKQVKPGIFTLKQYAIWVGVSEGRYPPEALDNLMPRSGHADAITEEQITQAGKAGVGEGMGVALLELVGLRKRAQRAAQQAQAQAQTQQAAAQPQQTPAQPAAPDADKK